MVNLIAVGCQDICIGNFNCTMAEARILFEGFASKHGLTPTSVDEVDNGLRYKFTNCAEGLYELIEDLTPKVLDIRGDAPCRFYLIPQKDNNGYTATGAYAD